MLTKKKQKIIFSLPKICLQKRNKIICKCFTLPLLKSAYKKGTKNMFGYPFMFIITKPQNPKTPKPQESFEKGEYLISSFDFIFLLPAR